MNKEETTQLLLDVASTQWTAEMRRIQKTGIKVSRGQRKALLEAAKTMFFIGHWLGFRAGRSEKRPQILAKALDIPTPPPN